ncbi:MAG: hypothetical protein VW450_04550 [Chloroflexota bacterium]
MGYGERGSIGHICPSIPLDMILDEVNVQLPDGVMMVYSTLYIQQLRQEDFDRAIASLDEAAEHMVDGGAECVIVGGGPVVAAVGSDEGVVLRTQAITRVPSVSTTGAMLTGIRSFGASKLAIATPYVEERNVLLANYLTSQGFTVTGARGLGLSRAADIARLPFETSLELAVDAARSAPGAEAIYIPCARFPVARNIAAIEAETGLPVVTSTQAMVWWGLRTLGITDSVEGHGSLYQNEVPA